LQARARPAMMAIIVNNAQFKKEFEAARAELRQTPGL
jgi:hypothetical protein